MRKILLIILVCLLLILTGFFMVNGLSAIGLKGIMDINKKDKEIEQKIVELSNEINDVYKGTETRLKSTVNTLAETKTEYENQAILSSSQSSSYVSQNEKYDIEYLWTRLGHFARDENCTLRIDVSKTGGVNENLYNLKFSVGGSYSGITDFIYDIENDSKFGFKIENFAITSPGESLTATFDCKDIPISEVQVERQDSSDSNAESNTTNTTNSSSNSTNSTNTSNTANETEEKN